MILKIPIPAIVGLILPSHKINQIPANLRFASRLKGRRSPQMPQGFWPSYSQFHQELGFKLVVPKVLRSPLIARIRPYSIEVASEIDGDLYILSKRALMATITVLALIRAAPMAGLRRIPYVARTPAASGMANALYPVAQSRFWNILE
jgi:hypothetical protein